MVGFHVRRCILRVAQRLTFAVKRARWNGILSQNPFFEVGKTVFFVKYNIFLFFLYNDSHIVFLVYFLNSTITCASNWGRKRQTWYRTTRTTRSSTLSIIKSSEILKIRTTPSADHWCTGRLYNKPQVVFEEEENTNTNLNITRGRAIRICRLGPTNGENLLTQTAWNSLNFDLKIISVSYKIKME